MHWPWALRRDTLLFSGLTVSVLPSFSSAAVIPGGLVIPGRKDDNITMRLVIPDDIITIFVDGSPDLLPETVRAVIPDGKDDNITMRLVTPDGKDDNITMAS